MENKKFIFIGNRFAVLNEMRQHKLAVEKILAVEDSFLHREMASSGAAFSLFKSKKELCDIIEKIKFDVLVSNGCPYILPVSKLQKPGQVFINIHPSYLPDLKGINPVNGAILFDRMAGATCHIMDDSVDGGPIISRIGIKLTPDIDLERLYQLSFAAEREVFAKALKRDFVPDENISMTLPDGAKPVYYTRKDKDMEIKFEEEPEQIVRRVRAFGIPSQGARFNYKGEDFKVLDAEIVEAVPSAMQGGELEIAAIQNNAITFRKGKTVIKFKRVDGPLKKLKLGDRLG